MCRIDIRSYILSFYYLVFGALSIGVEFKFEKIRQYVRILFSFVGRGFWYTFLGTIAFGGEWWAMLIAGFLIFAGVLNFIAVCANKDEADKTNDSQDNNIQQILDQRHENEKNQIEIQNNANIKDVNVNVAEAAAEQPGNNEVVHMDGNKSPINPFSDYDYSEEMQ
eukprot:CAMPEP_0202686336 /NCGR_PEP_ID=MMETSP1385-20130828/2153_1 /ASSEMBLY_ACC=CAM_ASM_000861 /TAXON_ID=933848 /ORGANISM="Elphidium margaritaceum" /LENGTH=165 /DNA_ID=CAMNT_0049340897 /DNA_START=199 /DNA_END=696 /DNA_ORIENTATION=+